MISFLGLFLGILRLLLVCSAADSIQQGQWIKDDGGNIVSEANKFVLGFFSPEGTSNRYLGIWYNEIMPQTVVWVANRERPILDKNGAFGITGNGTFVVLDGKNESVWNTNSSITSSNATMVLLDTGELFILKGPRWMPNNTIWQSFHHPTDTFLPEMRVILPAGETKLFTSWTNSGNPSPGRFSIGIDPRASLQIVIWEGEKRYWRSGHWDGRVFLGVPIRTDFVYGFILSTGDDDKLYLDYKSNPSDLIMFKINWNGKEVQQMWNESRKQWNKIQEQPADDCGVYNHCSKFARCDSSSSNDINCVCIDGFQPSDSKQWNAKNWTGGCTRRTPLQCQKNSGGAEKDGFLEVKHIKLPDFADIDKNMRSREDCRKKCEDDCSCNAYAPPVPGGISCMLWSNELLDMMQLDEGTGSSLFVRLHPSELDKNGDAATTGDGGSGKTKKIILACGITLGIVLFLLFVLFQLKRRNSLRVNRRTTEFRDRAGERGGDHLMSAIAISNKRELSGETTDEFELPVFDLSTILMATDNFGNANKLGQGGFGYVYKGILVGGEEIAVKRLSKNSRQGAEEFKNELRLVARLQHRNLIRLLGCCVDNEEKMLVYEYMENKSLDSILFNKQKSSLLDWKTRFNIICGIARGLLYLHQDSRFRIIHRDLKASNILLDKEMNPKISYFGMARIFGGDETEANNTRRVVGTYGYMSPEYAMDGLFSVKSDAFSFGVLVLEIVTGKHNRGFYRQTNEENLLGLVWRLWRERRGLELRDSTMISEAYSEWDDQVMRSIQVGLLCVQEKAEDRPNMATVMFMLSSEGALLPQPKQPGFCLQVNNNNAAITNSSSSNHNHQTLSLNELTVTELHGR